MLPYFGKDINTYLKVSLNTSGEFKGTLKWLYNKAQEQFSLTDRSLHPDMKV